MRLALLGFGNVGRAFARLLAQEKSAYPFRITGVATARHGAAFSEKGIGPDTELKEAFQGVDAFLERTRPDIFLELTTLNPASGEPAISHIRTAFGCGSHVVTANKGPIAYAYSDLCAEARASGVEFRFESTCMDGAPVFNMVRNCLPAVRVLGFTGVLNSTSKVAIDAMRAGRSMEEGLNEARAMGIAEADASYDIDGWDSAAKTAALANVLMNARMTPAQVDRRGIGGVTTGEVQALARERKTICLVSRARAVGDRIILETHPQVLDDTDLMASVHGTSNLLLLHTDLMGTVGTVSIAPSVDQTAYGVFSDVVDIARSL